MIKMKLFSLLMPIFFFLAVTNSSAQNNSATYSYSTPLHSTCVLKKYNPESKTWTVTNNNELGQNTFIIKNEYPSGSVSFEVEGRFYSSLKTCLNSVQKLGPPLSNDLARLNYYPHAGKFKLTTSLEYNSFTETNSGPAPIIATTSNTKLIPFILDIEYGLSPGLRIGISETERTHGSAEAPQGTTTSSGLSNPTLNMFYRFLEEQKMIGWSGDVSLDITPNWVARGTGRTGTGFGTASLAVPIYWGDTNELGFVPSVLRTFNYVNPVTSATLWKAYWTPAFSLKDRYHFNQNWFTEPSLDLTFGANITELASHVQESSISISPTALVGYKIQNSLLLIASIKYSNSTSIITPNLANGIQINTNSKITTAGISAQFEF